MRGTFLNYANWRWLKLNSLLVVAMIAGYLWIDPIGGHNGGTVVGYTYGVIAALGILYLMWYGVRKRSYYAQHTTLLGCLSAHVWLGIALAIIVPLHAGFSFGLNVHTLAYALMVGTVASGAWGAMHYTNLAPEIQAHRGGGSVKKLLEQVHLLSQEIAGLSKDKSDQFVAFANKVDFKFNPTLRGLLKGDHSILSKGDAASLLESLPPAEQDEGLKLVALVTKKHDLVTRVRHDVEVTTKLKYWLYFHLPLSFGCLIALAIHIVSVFYYW